MKSVTDILKDDKLIRRARELSDMSECVRRYLPPPLNSCCWVGGFRNGTLELVTDNGAAAELIRCHGRQVLKQFNTEFGARTGRLRKVSVSVAGNLNAPESADKPKKK